MTKGRYNITDVQISQDYKEGDIDVTWQAKGIGFGHLSFKKKHDLIYCNNETMPKDFIKAVLCKLVDVAILTE